MSHLNPLSHPGLLVTIIAIYTAVFAAWGLTLEYTGRAWDALPDWLEQAENYITLPIIGIALLAFWIGVIELARWIAS